MRSLLLLCCLLLPACGNLMNLSAKAKAKQRQKELAKLSEAATSEASERLGEKAAGEVIYVDHASGFVLIRARHGLALHPGDELQCGASPKTKVRVTPESRNRNFFAADILAGTPGKGDPVIPVKSGVRPQPKLEPVGSASLAGGNTPGSAIDVDPSKIRPEDLPRSTLDDPPEARPVPLPSLSEDPGNLLTDPPLPEPAPVTPAEPKLPQ
jgi:hypothetical protein